MYHHLRTTQSLDSEDDYRSGNQQQIFLKTTFTRTITRQTKCLSVRISISIYLSLRFCSITSLSYHLPHGFFKARFQVRYLVQFFISNISILSQHLVHFFKQSFLDFRIVCQVVHQPQHRVRCLHLNKTKMSSAYPDQNQSVALTKSLI